MNVSHSDVKNGKLPGIESDPARVPGVEKCRKRSLLPTYSNGPSRLVGIQWAFKRTRGTFIFKLHWVGSTIQFVSCACLRTQFTRLRTELTVEAAEGLYCTGKMSDPGHSIGSRQLPGSLRTLWSGKMSDPGRTWPTHVGIQTDPGPLFSSFTGLVALGYQKHSLRNELRMN